MRIRHNFKNTRGFLTAANRSVRLRYMITDEAKRRVRALTHWERYGLAAAMDAYEASERTLRLWKRNLKAGNGKLESLNSGSRAPKRRRKRHYDTRIVTELKRLRREHPNLGEKKLYPILKEYCDRVGLGCPKPATIGNLIRDHGGLRTVPARITNTGRVKPYVRTPILRKPRQVTIATPGALVALDTIERHELGTRRYIITVEDIYSRFSFAWCTTSHASKAAEEFFASWCQVFPYVTRFVLTDNGSEFKKHFTTALHHLQITHYHTYPKTPKMNAHIERFNRTIQEEFVDHHRELLRDPDQFNAALMEYLCFYNTKRVHHAFANKLTPVEKLLQYRPLAADCKSTLGHTSC